MERASVASCQQAFAKALKILDYFRVHAVGRRPVADAQPQYAGCRATDAPTGVGLDATTVRQEQA
jgi:hypothetical protein